MAKRKQELIFSRLKMMKADLPPEKQQVGNSVREMYPAVSAGATEGNPGREPEPVKAEEKPVISGVISSRIDLFAPLESFFVQIAPGTFTMGSPEYEAGRSSDETMHEVTLTKGFHMLKTPVTLGQWKAVTGQ